MKSRTGVEQMTTGQIDPISAGAAVQPRVSPELPIPERMRAWTLSGSDELSASSKPVPSPGRAEVLVKIDAVAICATDLEIIHYGSDRRRRLREVPISQGFHAGTRVHGAGRRARYRRRLVRDRRAGHGRDSCRLRALQAMSRGHVYIVPKTMASITVRSARDTGRTAS